MLVNVVKVNIGWKGKCLCFIVFMGSHVVGI
jgi:hypothetical protein